MYVEQCAATSVCLLIASICYTRTLFSITLQLLDSGANVHFVNQALEARGGSALHEAARNRNEQMADLLLAHGAYPFQLNPAGRYAWGDLSACSCRYFYMV
jgi:ankyrin repeat protein